VETRFNEMLRDEFYRPITLREGSKRETVPTGLALIRGVMVEGARGNRLARQLALKLVAGIEDKRIAARKSAFQRFFSIQKLGYEKLVDPPAYGLEEADIVPHPDDIVLDHQRGEVAFKGPITVQQRDAQDRLASQVPELIEQVAKLRRSAAKRPGDASLREKFTDAQAQLDEALDIAQLVRERAAKPGKYAGPFVRHVLAKPDLATALDPEALKTWRAQQEAEYEREMDLDRQQKDGKREAQPPDR
jgi:hypothetical protein